MLQKGHNKHGTSFDENLQSILGLLNPLEIIRKIYEFLVSSDTPTWFTEADKLKRKRDTFLFKEVFPSADFPEFNKMIALLAENHYVDDNFIAQLEWMSAANNYEVFKPITYLIVAGFFNKPENKQDFINLFNGISKVVSRTHTLELKQKASDMFMPSGTSFVTTLQSANIANSANISNLASALASDKIPTYDYQKTINNIHYYLSLLEKLGILNQKTFDIVVKNIIPVSELCDHAKKLDKAGILTKEAANILIHLMDTNIIGSLNIFEQRPNTFDRICNDITNVLLNMGYLSVDVQTLFTKKAVVELCEYNFRCDFFGKFDNFIAKVKSLLNEKASEQKIVSYLQQDFDIKPFMGIGCVA